MVSRLQVVRRVNAARALQQFNATRTVGNVVATTTCLEPSGNRSFHVFYPNNERQLCVQLRTNARDLSTVHTPSSSPHPPSVDAFASHNETFTDPEPQILRNALKHVNEHGWTVEALAAGAKDMGYPSVAHGMFPRGAIELVDYFMDSCKNQLREKLIANTGVLQTMSVTDRLKFGIRSRLELVQPVLSSWPQAMGLGALPQNAPTTMQKLAALSDEIWYFAGDKSTDASWYTKRAILTGIYASTELFMLSDNSPNFQDTWQFLDRRVEETVALGELPQNLSDVAGMVTIGIQSIVSAATSLAGPLSSQILSNTPLKNVPNPISAIGNVVPSSFVPSSFPPNPLGGSNVGSGFPEPPTMPTDLKFETKDLHEIDQELEKLGGSHSRRPRS